MKVVVTGAAGRLAQAVLPALCQHPGVEEVRGIDLRPPAYAHPKFRGLQAALGGPGLDRWLAGADALVHLAFVVLRGRTALATMRAVNVEGSLTLFARAKRLGVRRRIFLSSAAVYGGGEALDETAPFAPLPGFAYAWHKAAVEQALQACDPQALRLRPHAIVGPRCQPLLKALLAQPFYVRLPDPQPQLQCVHEEDVAQAVIAALTGDARGPFNLAAEGSFSFREAVRERHRRAVPLSLAAARRLVGLGWRLTGLFGEPGWVEGLARSLTLDCTRAHTELGWRPRYDCWAALEATVPLRGGKGTP
ncbi:NAD-dependent epimerase/dehydratase family protein [Pelomicrobium sp.]|uniref:NAD-dependent epimerase/dehydratase family protein n=1 Tax=Pelomicrobium sp. TaxID=2815319 RepID=UPI002FDF00A4